MSFISIPYLKSQLVLLGSNAFKSFLATLIFYLTQIYEYILPYFFGEKFLTILTVLLISDLTLGVIKHLRLGDFSRKQMFHKFAFKLMITAIATVSAKSIINIHDVLNYEYIVVATQLTIALYLYGSIDKNLCQMTGNKLCFGWLIKRIENIISKKSK